MTKQDYRAVERESHLRRSFNGLLTALLFVFVLAPAACAGWTPNTKDVTAVLSFIEIACILANDEVEDAAILSKVCSIPFDKVDEINKILSAKREGKLQRAKMGKPPVSSPVLRACDVGVSEPVSEPGEAVSAYAKSLGWKADSAEMKAAVNRLMGVGMHDRFGTTPPPDVAKALIEHVVIRDQKDTSACVGFAMTGAAYARLHRLGYKVSLFSPLVSYGIARQLEGRRSTALADVGSYPYLAMEGMRRFGLAPESVLPFDAAYRERVTRELDFDAFHTASQFRVANFARISVARAERVLAIKQSLAIDIPVPFGSNIGDAVFNWKPGNAPVPLEINTAGGHMMFVAGYDSYGVGTAKKTVFIIANSWNKSYGDAGYVLFSEEKMTAAQTSDLYSFTISDTVNAIAPAGVCETCGSPIAAKSVSLDSLDANSLMDALDRDSDSNHRNTNTGEDDQ